MDYREFLTYLFDRPQTRELAVELAVAIDDTLEARPSWSRSRAEPDRPAARSSVAGSGP